MINFVRHRQLCRILSILLLMDVPGCDRDDPSPPNVGEVKIEMTGHDFRWHSRYAGADGQLETDDDVHAAQVLHVPVNSHVEIVLKSLDYLYSLEVPQARRKEIAVPDLTFSLNFKADKIGTFEMPGDQLCGYTHPDLTGTLIVESQSDYARWLTSQR